MKQASRSPDTGGRAWEAADLDRAGAEVTLDALLAHAERHAPALVGARGELARGRAEIDAAEPVVPSDPKLSGRVGMRRAGGSNGIDYGVGVTQSIEAAGQPRLRRRAARALYDAAEARFAQERWGVHRRVHAGFHLALVARARLRAADRVLDFSESVLSVARQRLAAGETSPLPVRIAEGELAQARQQHVAATAAYRSSLLELAAVAGWSSDPPPVPAGRLTRPRHPPPASTLVALARVHHPELVATRTEVLAAEAQADLADRRRWSSASVGAFYERESDPAGSQPASIWSATVTMPLPLWQRSRPGRARARAAKEAAAATAAAAAAGLDAAVRRAVTNVEAHARRIEAYGAEILPRFEENLDLLRTAFELGEIDMTEVLVARERFLRVQRDALDAHDAYYRAVAELESVVGVEIAELHEQSATGSAVSNGAAP